MSSRDSCLSMRTLSSLAMGLMSVLHVMPILAHVMPILAK